MIKEENIFENNTLTKTHFDYLCNKEYLNMNFNLTLKERALDFSKNYGMTIKDYHVRKIYKRRKVKYKLCKMRKGNPRKYPHAHYRDELPKL